MKIQIGKYYLIRQRYQYGSDKHDDIMVVKCIKKASPVEASNYMRFGDGDCYFGRDIKDKKDDELKFFENDEIITSIKI